MTLRFAYRHYHDWCLRGPAKERGSRCPLLDNTISIANRWRTAALALKVCGRPQSMTGHWGYSGPGS